jgi:peptidoglycan/xylan/chitin deacetylase (PgdA/CDA1 family)
MLEILRELDARATFFLLGEKIAGHPDLVRQILQEGHEVGLHGWSHRILTDLTPPELRDEIQRSDESLSACGAVTRLYRPPFGVLPWRHLRLLWRLQRTVVLWNVDSGDWEAEDREQVSGRVRPSALQRGDIILFHEKSAVTPDAVAEVGAQLLQRGIGLVTVSHLIAGSR